MHDSTGVWDQGAASHQGQPAVPLAAERTGQRASTDYLTRIAGCKYRNLAEPGPERQNGRVYSAGFFEDRWRRYPDPSLSRGCWPAAGFGSSRS